MPRRNLTSTTDPVIKAGLRAILVTTMDLDAPNWTGYLAEMLSHHKHHKPIPTSGFVPRHDMIKYKVHWMEGSVVLAAPSESCSRLAMEGLSSVGKMTPTPFAANRRSRFPTLLTARSPREGALTETAD